MSKELLFSKLGVGTECTQQSSAINVSGDEYDYPMADETGNGHKEGKIAHLKVLVVKDHVAKAWIVMADSKIIQETE